MLCLSVWTALQRTVQVRPEGVAASGRWPVPEWAVWAVGGVIFLGAVALLLRRIRQR